MKFDYEYIVHSIDVKGIATVEYKCKELGAHTRLMFVPYLEGESAVRQKIIEHFPHQEFYGRWVAFYNDYEEKRQAANEITGTLSFDFQDYFYSIQTNVADVV